MINSASLHHVSGSYNCDINTDIIPLHDFDVTVTNRVDTSRQKSQDRGLWPTQSGLRDSMEIHMEGDIFGISSADYFTNRMTLVKALFGNAQSAVVLTYLKFGDLVINIEGAGEDWTCEYTVTLFSAPLQGLSPSRTPWACTLVSWTPYFTGVSSGNLFYYS